MALTKVEAEQLQAAQTSITSVGTLTSLTVSGALNGTLSTAAQPNITSVGTLTGLTVSGNTALTLNTSAQPNITSVGTLTALTISGNLTVDTNTLKVDSINNRVGIGTASPGYIFEIQEASYSRLSLRQSTTGKRWQLGNDGSNLYIFDESASKRVIDFKSDGNVGIGVTNPQVALHIRGSAVSGATFATEDGITLEQPASGGSNINIISTSSTQGGILFSDENTRAVGRINYINSGDYMQFYTDSAERMRINSSGNVIINQPSFSSLPTGSKLNIFGDGTTLRLDGSSATTKSILFRNVNAGNPGEVYADGSLRFRTEDASTRITFHTNSSGSNNERMRIDSSGNVGIGTGTSTLLGKLHIAETAGGAAGVDFPIVLSSDRYQADYGLGIVFRPENLSTNYAHKTAIIGSGGGYGYNQADLHFCLNQDNDVTTEVSLSDARVTIKKNGNVGIGTQNISATLDIVGGGASTSPTLELNSSTSTEYNHSINAFNSNLTSGENNLFVIGKEGSLKNSGYIGYKFNGAGSNTNLLTFGHWSSNNLMNLSADGKLGIGTQTPAEKLHVEGSLLVDAFSAGSETGIFFREGFSSSNKYNQSILAYDHSGSAPDGLSINAYDGISFCTGSNSRQQRMLIDQAGRVSKPLQPYFQAFRSGSQTGYNASGNFASVVIYNNATINVGGHYNASTGYFTAPVEGIYIFFAAAYISGWAAGQSWFSSTSGRLSGTDIVYYSGKTFPEASIIIKMGANDTVGFHPYAASTTNATILANANHTFFRGYFLG